MQATQQVSNAQAAFTASRQESVNVWGGLQPVIVHSLRNSTKSKTFCWDGDLTRLQVSEPLEKLFKWLNVPANQYRFDFRGYVAWDCLAENCEAERVYLPMANCGIHHPWTSFKHVSRCAARIIEQLEFLEQHSNLDYLSHVVLTAPDFVSEYLGGPHVIHKKERGVWVRKERDLLEDFRGAVRYFIKLLGRRLFPHHPAVLGGWFGLHVWSSSHPLTKHLHAHLLMPNVSYNTKEKTFYRFSPHVDDRTRRLIRECWREALIKFAMWDHAVPDDFLPDASIKNYPLRVLPRAYRAALRKQAFDMSNPDNPAEIADNYARLLKSVPKDQRTEFNPQVIHRLRYAFRSPLVDLNENLEPQMLAGANREWVTFLINYTTRRSRAGFLSMMVKVKTVEEITGVERVQRVALFKHLGLICRNSLSARCPLCGSAMVKMGTVKSNLPDLPHLIRDRDGEWVEVPPPFEPLPNQTDEIRYHGYAAPARADPDTEKRARAALRGGGE